jgi:guanylate kinase
LLAIVRGQRLRMNVQQQRHAALLAGLCNHRGLHG